MTRLPHWGESWTGDFSQDVLLLHRRHGGSKSAIEVCLSEMKNLRSYPDRKDVYEDFSLRTVEDLDWILEQAGPHEDVPVKGGISLVRTRYLKLLIPLFGLLGDKRELMTKVFSLLKDFPVSYDRSQPMESEIQYYKRLTKRCDQIDTELVICYDLSGSDFLTCCQRILDDLNGKLP